MRENHTNGLFRTLRAMSTIVQNFFVGDWLSKRVKKSQSTTIAQFSTESAEEPLSCVQALFPPYGNLNGSNKGTLHACIII